MSRVAAHVVQDKVFVVHGGPPTQHTLEALRAHPPELRQYYDCFDHGFPAGFAEMLWKCARLHHCIESRVS